ncbi:hypothetical protein JCM10207_006419 [Rhodosporidiobolus poonsookiae]
MAKKLKAKVYVVATSNHILSSVSSLPPSAQHDPSELISGWANTLAAEVEELDPFAVALGQAKKPDAAVRVFTAASEVVPGALIDGFLTDKGFLSASGCALLASERLVAERLLFGRAA